MSYTDIFEDPLGFQLGLHMLHTLVLRVLRIIAFNFSWKNDIELLIPVFIFLCRVKTTCGASLFSFAGFLSLDLFDSVRAELLCTL